MTTHFSLSQKISFRCYDDFTILLDHGNGRIMRMNLVAGKVLERMDRGEPDFSDGEIAFIEQLVELGIVGINGEKSENSTVMTSGTGIDAESTVYVKLNDYAVKNYIPLHAEIELTHRCPLHCEHCYLQGTIRQPDNELSLSEIKDFLDQLARMGGLFLTLSGGEPTLRKDFEDIFRYARKKRFAVSLLTSGFGLKPEMRNLLADKGIDAVQVSIHGPDEEFHDAFTGVPGSFAAAWDTLVGLKSVGTTVRAAVCVHRKNYPLLDEITSRLENAGIPYNLNLNMLPVYEGRKPLKHLQLGPAEMESVLRKHSSQSIPRLKNKGLEDPPCRTGASVISIDPYGTTFPCMMLRQKTGSIRESSLVEIFKESKVLKGIRALRMKDLKECPECEKKKSCNRCTGLAVLEGLEITDHSSLDCIRAGMIYDK